MSGHHVSVDPLITTTENLGNISHSSLLQETRAVDITCSYRAARSALMCCKQNIMIPAVSLRHLMPTAHFDRGPPLTENLTISPGDITCKRIIPDIPEHHLSKLNTSLQSS